MSNFLRASVVVGILALVVGAAPLRAVSVTLDVDFIDQQLKVTAAGANGTLKGKGQLLLFTSAPRTAAYPITITSGAIGRLDVTLTGTVKRQNLRYPFVLVITRGSRVATMDISDPAGTPVLNTLTGTADTLELR